MSIPPFVPARLRRSIVFFLVVTATGLGLFLIIFPSPDLSQELELLRRVADLELRLRAAERTSARRRHDLNGLYREFSKALSVLAEGECADGQDATLVLRESVRRGRQRGHLQFDLPGVAMARGQNWTFDDLAVPDVHDFLPHTAATPDAFRPAFKMAPARQRTGVSLVLGIPTVKRDHQSYLSVTLRSLLENMSEEESADCLMVVMVAEADVEYAKSVAEEIKTQFPEAVESGLIEVISPPASYYPQWSNLKRTLGDEMGRVQWRSKQNLDYAFLMMYASNERGTFYVQLEDDILTKAGYLTTMREFALLQEAKDSGLAITSNSDPTKPPWFVIDYCQLGFIGKLFRSSDLPRLVQFFLLFYNDKPVDWLLENVLQTMVCKLDHDVQKCKKEKGHMWIHYKPSLFQHIGTHSSLRGKVQKLKDKQFGRVSMFLPHSDNPPARIQTQIKHYKAYSLTRAYAGETFFWGLAPQQGDTVTVELDPPVELEKFKFVSGNAEHPSDKLPEGTTVEVLLSAPALEAESILPREEYPRSRGGRGAFAVVGRFDSNGVAEGAMGGRAWGKVQAVRITIKSAGENWVILSELHLRPGDGTTNADASGGGSSNTAAEATTTRQPRWIGRR